MPRRQGGRRHNGLLAREVGEIALTIKVVEIGAIFEVADRGAWMIEVGRLGDLIIGGPQVAREVRGEGVRKLYERVRYS